MCFNFTFTPFLFSILQGTVLIRFFVTSFFAVSPLKHEKNIPYNKLTNWHTISGSTGLLQTIICVTNMLPPYLATNLSMVAIIVFCGTPKPTPRVILSNTVIVPHSLVVPWEFTSLKRTYFYTDIIWFYVKLRCQDFWNWKWILYDFLNLV